MTNCLVCLATCICKAIVNLHSYVAEYHTYGIIVCACVRHAIPTYRVLPYSMIVCACVRLAETIVASVK